MAWVLKMDDAAIESGLVHDFDASLSGIGQELGAGAYSMRLETDSNFVIMGQDWVDKEESKQTYTHTRVFLVRVNIIIPSCFIAFT